MIRANINQNPHCQFRGQPCSKAKRDLELVEREAEAQPEAHCQFRGQPCSKVRREIEEREADY